MTVRSKTVVVGAPAWRPNWPLERAALANKHAAALRKAESDCQRAVAVARRSAREEAEESFARYLHDYGDVAREVIRGAAAELGRSLGERVSQWAHREIDPLLAEKHRILDTVLARASVETHSHTVDSRALLVAHEVRVEPFVLRIAHSTQSMGW